MRTVAVRLVLLLALAASLLAALQFLPMPEPTRWWRTVYDAGHAPLFGSLAIVLLVVSTSVPRWKERSRWVHYLAAFTVAALLGAMAEAYQFVGPRDADPWDLMRNLAGAAAFLAFASTLDRGMEARMASPSLPVRGLLRVGAAVLLGLVLVPVGATGLAYLSRNAAFPRICSFESYWESFFLEPARLKLTLSYLPENLRGEQGDELVGRLEFASRRANRLILAEPYPDWSGYHTFVFEVYSPLDRPVELGLRIDDAEHDKSARDRYNTRFVVAPGRNEVRIPLADVRDAPATRPMDLERIRQVILFTDVSPESYTLYVDDFRLE